jgi:hypothetical protein
MFTFLLIQVDWYIIRDREIRYSRIEKISAVNKGNYVEYAYSSTEPTKS